MKILWVNANFLHPTNKGGSIRSLGMLRHLHRRHEIHFAALADPRLPEGPAGAGEYSRQAYPFPHRPPDRGSPRFWGQLLGGLVSPLPVAVKRFHVPAFGRELQQILRRERFDRAVVDHLMPAAHYPDLPHSLLFQHNVETIIWRRHAEQAATPVHRAYFQMQARRMFAFEKRVCHQVGHIVVVSPQDAAWTRELFGVPNVSEVPTGVDLEYFTPPGQVPKKYDFVFIGSMDWLANIDGVLYFVREILPLVRRRRPKATFAIVGRKPGPEIQKLAREDAGITVTGTVPDVRPYLWSSRLSIVPLRIGGGTRLKIYEAMAAKSPLVSTSIGAEGLEYTDGENIRIADSAKQFSEQCVDLIEQQQDAARLAQSAWAMVESRFTWDKVADVFERFLEQTPRPSLGWEP
jgi:glycosyltransferase involved in cell wall biosynthesis